MNLLSVKNLNKEINSIFNINWELTHCCNYHCSYCSVKHPEIKMHDVESIDYEKLIDRIEQQAKKQNYANFNYSFCGGEPTMNPRALAIFNCISRKKAQNKNSHYALDLSTNLYKDERWLSQFITATQSLDAVVINASWHREFADRDTFLKKVLYVMSNNVKIVVKIVMAVDMFDEYYADAMFFKNAGCSVQIVKERYSAASNKYTSDQIEILQSFEAFANFSAKNVTKIKSFKKPIEVCFDTWEVKQYKSEVDLYTHGISSFTRNALRCRKISHIHMRVCKHC